MKAAKVFSKTFSFRTAAEPKKESSGSSANLKACLGASSSQLSLTAPGALQFGVAENRQIVVVPEGVEHDSRSVSSSESAFASTTTKETFSSTGTAKSPPPSEQIKVAVRVRPLLPNEKETSEKKTWEWDSNSIQLLESDTNLFNPHSKAVKQAYQFDHLFSPESTNNHIFDSVVKNIVRSSMEGFHGSVFTYGQTSSGKTFTMNGDKGQPGIIPQAIAECFDAVQNMPGRDFILRVSYLEVYNEQIKDLLSMDPVPVRIQHDPKRGTVLTGVKEQVVLNTQQVLALIKSGEAHRHVGSTDMNEKSSRAHTLFKIIIESTSSDKKEPVKVSSLYLVDLAGSESAKMTNSKGERAREAKHINQSLLTLSTIIQRLSEDRSGGAGKRTQHLPYRDSKLTRILEPALDGNAQIGIICTVSPTFKCMEETSNTLKFASRAKMIKMHAKVNETIDDKTLLRVYKEEIEQLRVRLRELETQTRLQQAMAASTDNTEPGRHQRNHSGSSFGGWEDSENGRDVDEEDANVMLQMIAEMERLILRADGSKAVAGLARRPSGRPSDSTTSPVTDKSSTLKERKRSSRKANPEDSDLIDVSATINALRQKSSPQVASRKNSVRDGTRKFRNSSAAMLSLIVEATESNDLMRLDTLDELELPSTRHGGKDASDSDRSDAEDEEESVQMVSESMDDLLMSSDDASHAWGAGLDMGMGSIYSGSVEMLDMEISEEDRAALAVASTLESIILRLEGTPTDVVSPQRPSSVKYQPITDNPLLRHSSSRRDTSGTMIPRPASLLRPESRQFMSYSVDEDDTHTTASVACPTDKIPSWDEYDIVDDIRLSEDSVTSKSGPGLVPELVGVDFTASGEAQEEAGGEDDSVLLGVSKMLVVLKGHVSKARSRLIT